MGEAFTYLLGIPFKECRESVYDSVIEYGKQIYISMGKSYNLDITKEEFVAWTKKNLFDKGINTVDSILFTIAPQLKRYLAGLDQSEAMQY